MRSKVIGREKCGGSGSPGAPDPPQSSGNRTVGSARHSPTRPTEVAGINVLTRAGTALRQPIGPIHWAGTETAVYWQGYMDGAVTSGYRAAGEVSAALV